MTELWERPPDDGWAVRLWAAEHLLVMLDYDGTLAPIVPDPDEAWMDPACIEVLKALSLRTDVTVGIITGRTPHDLERRLQPVLAITQDFYLAAEHGLVAREPGGSWTTLQRGGAASMPEVLRRLHEALPSGVRVEEKAAGITVHLRGVTGSPRREAEEAVVRASQAHTELLLLPGKEVLELRLKGAPDKGAAADWMRARVRSRNGTPSEVLGLFIGDDTTDEHAFLHLARSGQGLGIRVGPGTPEGGTAAGAVLSGQSAVAPALWWLFRLRGSGKADRV